MQRILSLLAAGVCAGALTGLAVPAQAAPDVTLTRLDCGTPQPPVAVNERFSDTYAYGDLKLQFVYSCYLVKHGDQYLLWDTGHAMTTPKVAPKVSIVDQLAKINVKPDQINYVGISHYRADHTGQVASFPSATLLIGKGDWDRIASPTGRRQLQAVRRLDQGREQVRGAGDRQGRIRRRQRHRALHARPYAR